MEQTEIKVEDIESNEITYYWWECPICGEQSEESDSKFNIGDICGKCGAVIVE